MARVIAVLVVACMAAGLRTPAAAQRRGGPLALSAEYAGSVEDGPIGLRWGSSLRTFTGRFELWPEARVSPWLSTGLDIYRPCGTSAQNCPENGWLNLAGLRASLLPVAPMRRLDPYGLAGAGGVLTFAGGGGSVWTAGGGMRLATRGAVDPRLELRWERHQRHDYLMLGLGANIRVRPRGPAADR